jgi:hypothetical protein
LETPPAPPVPQALQALPILPANLKPSKSKRKGKGRAPSTPPALVESVNLLSKEPLPPDVTSAGEYSWDDPPRTREVEELENLFESEYSVAKRAVLDFSLDGYNIALPAEIAQQIQHIYHNTKVTETNVAVAGFRRRWSLYMLATIHKGLEQNLGTQETATNKMLRDIYKQDDLEDNIRAKRRRLRYRLRAGERWHQLVSAFGVGILALPQQKFPHYLYGNLVFDNMYVSSVLLTFCA